jgi:2-polyprenyl-3-methyl-5-hydroxy-6-metoxy-1,4-benzoquinol methylase
MKSIFISFLVILSFIKTSYAESKSPMSNSRLSQLSGEKDQSYDTKSKWDQRYNKRNYIYGKRPAKFLAENFDFIPKESSVLDMGMGEGRNAVFLATKGHKVTGIDISSVAVKKARKLAKENKVKIKTVVGTLNKYQIAPQSFDVIICFYYVDHNLDKTLQTWLKPGGLLIYEAHTVEQLKHNENGKTENKSYYLKSQELLTMFPNMKVLKYEEPLHEDQFTASIILQKK